MVIHITNKTTLVDVLDSKEKRADIQKELVGKYNNSLISFTLNIPGEIKDSPIYRAIHMEGIRIIKAYLNKESYPILYEREIENKTGREAYIIVEADAIILKNIMVEVEESNPIGRIFDIDVFDRKHHQISRADLGKSPRKCLICNMNARTCMRRQKHNYESLIEEINNIWNNYEIY